jgi:5-methylthioribose kinase
MSGNATVEVLTGGVSCVVLAVQNDQVDLVVKQALPELKTKAKWVADQRRAIVEADAMQIYHSITPASVPELIDLDPDNFTLTMSRLPHTCTNWKQDMLEGRIHPEMEKNSARYWRNGITSPPYRKRSKANLWRIRSLSSCGLALSIARSVRKIPHYIR